MTSESDLDMELYIKHYIKDNLTIEVSQVTEFGPIEEIKVELVLEGETICNSSCSLPRNNND